MIYYDIQHHGDVEDLMWLSEHLGDGDDFLNFSLDIPARGVEQFGTWLKSKGVNGRARMSLPVVWCGPSQITQMFHSLYQALEHDGWEYFVNLSGTCFPTKPSKQFKDFLREQYRDGLHSFSFTFSPKKPSLWISHGENNQDAEYRKIKYLRLEIECSRDVAREFDQGFHPVKNVMERRSVHCTEVPHEGRLILRGLLPWELKSREKFWSDNTYTIGRTWSVLHRKQVEWIVDSLFSQEMYLHCLNMFEPDETYIPSLLMSNYNPYRGGVLNDNLRYSLGSPGVVDFSNISKVLGSPSFFARKLVGGKGREMVRNVVSDHISYLSRI